MLTYISLVLTLPVLSNTFSIDDSPYCGLRYKRLCMGKGLHVGCQFPDDVPGVTCINYTNVRFTPKNQRFITHYLNRRRQRIAAGSERVKGGAKVPAPKVMMLVVSNNSSIFLLPWTSQRYQQTRVCGTLPTHRTWTLDCTTHKKVNSPQKWDQELAMLAERLANQCLFMHDDCRATVKYPHAGQTVGEVRWRRANIGDALDLQRLVARVLSAWWGERRYVNPQQLTAPFRIATGPRGATWGHFSQLAVWSLQAVGCGAANHLDGYTLLLVCDFSHTNMLGQRTLLPGPVGQCPPYTGRRRGSGYPLLCTPVQYSITDDRTDDDYDDETSRIDDETTTTTRITTKKTNKPTYSKKPMTLTRSRYYNVKKTSIPEGFRQTVESSESEHDDEETTRNRVTFDRRQNFHSSFRPIRPGAKALFNTQPGTIFQKQTRQHITVTLAFDEEDMMQLFKDTGFSLKPRVLI